MQTHVTFSHDISYPLICTQGAFDPGNQALAGVLSPDATGVARVLVVIDGGLALAQPDLEARIQAWFTAHRDQGRLLAASPAIVTGGEAAKQGLDTVQQVARLALEAGLCRHSYILAIGGGAMLDAVGMAAALVHRGLRLVRMPSTVLAQNDAGVGVKNGVNWEGHKNALGCFAPPHAVVNDHDLLTSLSDRDWRAGIAEAFKVALIKDADLLAWLLHRCPDLARRDLPTMAELVRRTALLHIDHIAHGGDPFETGSSRPLDFGHWAAHRLETISRHRLNHGEAVAIGMAIDLGYAVRRLGFPATACSLILDGLRSVGFQLWDPALELVDGHGRRRIYGGLEDFRTHLGGQLTIAMPDGIGRRQDIHEIDTTTLDAVLEHLRSIAGRAATSTTRSPSPSSAT